MPPPCEISPPDKKAFISAVGKELVQRHGKQKYYRTDDVGRAATAKGYPIDWACLALCFYSSPGDFARMHQAPGEECNYASMKAQVLAEIAGPADFQWLDSDLSWLEWPDIDLSKVFDWFDWSP